ncbi:MAG: hypothetical protein WCL07_05035, partial [bacterium]
GSGLSSCLPSLANLASSSLVNSFIYIHLLSFGFLPKINGWEVWPYFPYLGVPKSRVNFARANEVQFIEAKRKPLQKEG